MGGISLPAVAMHSDFSVLKGISAHGFLNAGESPSLLGGAANSLNTLASAASEVIPQLVTLNLVSSAATFAIKTVTGDTQTTPPPQQSAPKQNAPSPNMFMVPKGPSGMDS